MTKIQRYLRIYRSFVKINVAHYVTYRANFISASFVGIGWGIFSIIQILLLMSDSSVIFGWTRIELLILTAAYSVIAGMFHVLFTRNFEIFSSTIHMGDLNALLLKPVDSQFLMSTQRIGVYSISRILLAFAFVIWLIVTNNIDVSVIAWLYFIGLGIFGIILFYSLFYIIMTCTIWWSHLRNLVDLLFHFMDTAKYPKEMYRSFFQYGAFFLLPLALVVSLPTKALFQKASWNDISILVVLSSFLFVVSRRFWKFALRYYTSASS